MSILRVPRACLAVLVAALVVVGVFAGPAAFAAGNANSGDGTMTVTPATVVAGSTANRLVFTFTATTGKFTTGSLVTLTVPQGWSQPSTNSSAPGYTTVSGCSAGTPSIAGAGPWTITVSQSCDAGTALTLTYGANSQVVAPTTVQTATFTAGSRISNSGSAVPLTAGSPQVTVTAGAASKLAFTTPPPSTGTAGVALADFQVSVQDAFGNTVTTATDPISLTIGSGPSGGTFSSAPSTYTNVAASSGVARFTGVALGLAGTYTLTAVRTGLASATSPSIVVSAGAGSKLAFVQGPSDGFAGTALSPAITVQVLDQSGNAVATAGIAVTLAPSAGVISSGASATTDSTGKATFGNVVINTTALGLTLTASATGLTSTAPSTTFNVTVAVSSGAALTNTPSDGSGSGVKSVAYYYCTGYSGTCTSANWTPIGSSTSAATNYQVTWTSTPAAGAYRVVATSTDNVTNTSQPTTSTPVTVTS
ncbi:hypothetical protein [Kribbella sp.]|uniref:hypothetical protein n=1 Tax=Kribbella sp. TaxID=1871183 RepID=UPI002D233DC6|nr:hypothetical protein [Kribbella sp.]HZX01786.1 hypothetical protein [Kribbella sp.]